MIGELPNGMITTTIRPLRLVGSYTIQRQTSLYQCAWISIVLIKWL